MAHSKAKELEAAARAVCVDEGTDPDAIIRGVAEGAEWDPNIEDNPRPINGSVLKDVARWTTRTRLARLHLSIIDAVAEVRRTRA